ncbi:hypothetical protein J7E91_35295 [Streptomyces sp. ISL-99]|uniref:hypothetical protein n=1 Tax=Streptomyces sp. ISL-99 TaxID=2819193 RepID=UPI001BE661DF|nr:hypothetical protein [Streptomyces sp. ISL-99]MBT2530471.1 hypothetical protein [Streptomyces sp. ISL-99]
MSAEGEADFHSLQQAGQVLYGFDSQTSKVWASSDQGRTWDRRARLPIGDLAAHASAPQEVWATTANGLVFSGDGGRTFRSAPGAPDLAVIERPASDAWVALGPDGKVLGSRDGRAWGPRGSLPSGAKPTLLTAVSPMHLLAADAVDTVYESKDGGRSWKVLHRADHESGDNH